MSWRFYPVLQGASSGRQSTGNPDPQCTILKGDAPNNQLDAILFHCKFRRREARQSKTKRQSREIRNRPRVLAKLETGAANCLASAGDVLLDPTLFGFPASRRFRQ
jgi:hypothetical protein